MSGNFEISMTLKLIIAVAVIGAVGFFVMLNQNQVAFEAQQLPNGDLSTLQTMGRAEVKSFESWCAQQGHQGDVLIDCVKRRQNRARLLVAQSKCAQDRAKEQLKTLTPEARSSLIQEVIKARQPSLQQRLTREEQASQPQKAGMLPPTDQELMLHQQSQFSSSDQLEVSKCAYEMLCTQQGHSGEQLTECVAKIQK